MTIYRIGPFNSFDSNVYLVSGSRPLIVDAGSGLCHDQIVAAIRDLIVDDPCTIVATHCHYDHIGGFDRLAHTFGALKMAGHKDAVYMRSGDPNVTVSTLFSSNMKPIEDLHNLHDGDVIDTGDHTFTVIETPGHTPGGICLVDQHGALISGDTLFTNGIGRTDFCGGSFVDLSKSLHRLSKIHISGLFPGHGDVSYGYGPEDVADIIRIMGA